MSPMNSLVDTSSSACQIVTSDDVYPEIDANCTCLNSCSPRARKSEHNYAFSCDLIFLKF